MKTIKIESFYNHVFYCKRENWDEEEDLREEWEGENCREALENGPDEFMIRVNPDQIAKFKKVVKTLNKIHKLNCEFVFLKQGKNKIKDKLEKERDLVVEQMSDMGKMNPKTGEWEAMPEPQDFPEADANDQADRFEEFESRSSMIKDLAVRLKNILSSLRNINRPSFAKCEVCGKDIEISRMDANPAAKTCKKHL